MPAALTGILVTQRPIGFVSVIMTEFRVVLCLPVCMVISLFSYLGAQSHRLVQHLPLTYNLSNVLDYFVPD